MVQLPETLAITTFSLRLDLRSLKKSTFFYPPFQQVNPSLQLLQKNGRYTCFNHATKNLCIPIIGLFFEARQIDPKNNGQHQEALQPSPSATSKKFHRILGVDAQPKC